MIGRRAQERIRNEAAAWVRRLQDAHTAEDRRLFEDWIARDPEHRRAYDQAVAGFDLSGDLATSQIGRRRSLDAVFPARRSRLGWSLATAGAAALALVGAYQLTRGFNLSPVPIATVMLTTGATETKNLVLADGTKLIIAPASRVRIDLREGRRVAELLEGRVRLMIAKEERPFLIVAGTRTLEASEGVFDAKLTGTTGAIGPATPAAQQTSATTDTSGAPLQSQISADGQHRFEFDSEPLASAVDRVNRADIGPKIELDPDLAGLPVTGVFQQGGSESIARAVALAFDLHLQSTPSGSLRLTRKK